MVKLTSSDYSSNRYKIGHPKEFEKDDVSIGTIPRFEPCLYRKQRTDLGTLKGFVMHKALSLC
jgi:hypothetical protein